MSPDVVFDGDNVDMASLPRACTAALLALLSTRCASTENAEISTSLSALVSETHRYWGEVFKNSEVFSINGLLPAPDVGLVYHYSQDHRWIGNLWGGLDRKNLPPSSMVAISRNHSFRLVGESVADDELLKKTVFSVRDQLLELRDLTESAIRTTAEIALATNGSGAADNANEVSELRTRRHEIDEKIQKGHRALDALLHVPGIIIARWSSKNAEGATAAAGSVASGSTEHTQARSGFIVIAGLRVVELVVGDDFKQMIAQLARSDEAAIDDAAITTFMLQSKYTCYVADTDIGARIRASLSANLKSLENAASIWTSINQLSINYYLDSFEQLGNRGDVGPLKWSKEPYCFLSGNDFENEKDPSFRWNTIQAEFVHPGLLVDAMKSEYKKEWDENELPPHQEVTGRKPCDAKHCDRWPQLNQVESKAGGK